MIHFLTMSQTTITSFYNSRKRPAAAGDDVFGPKSKALHIEKSLRNDDTLCAKKTVKTCEIVSKDIKQTKETPEVPKGITLEAGRSVEPDRTVPQKIARNSVPTAFAKKSSGANIASNVTAKPRPETVNAARKELSLGDIRKKLAASSRLAELKATADRLSKGIQDLKQSTDKRNLKGFKSIDVEVPVSPSKNSSPAPVQTPKKAETLALRQLISPRKVVVSPVKSPTKVPAYIRHASLATSTSLPLPHAYRFLAELFRGMETVVALLYNKNEKITFDRLKPSVQEMLKRNYNEKHLSQIKHLVPDFYNFEVKKVANQFGSQKDKYELLISPNLPNDVKVMNPSVLLERRRYFYDTLLRLVKKHHAQYLQTLDPPMVIPDEKLTRWHPEFEIEKVPEVESAKLPEIPNVEKVSSAQDVLSKARELFKCNTKMERALERLAQAKSRGLTDEEKKATGITDETKTPQTASTQTPSTSGTNNVTLLNPALRNLPASLLEKVKAKQAAKALEAMTRTPQIEQKYLIYTRLPDLARTLRNIFVTERKNVLALNIILSKLESSFKANVSASDLQRDIKALTEEAPEFVKLHDVRNATYLKLDKNVDLNKVTGKLDALADKYKLQD